MPISPELQLERRKKILAKTREMITAGGIERLNVRELAKHCGVSVPTLYNQFNNKDNLVFAAADEIFRWHFERIGSDNSKKGLDRIINVNSDSVKISLKNAELTKLIAAAVPKQNNSLVVAQSLYQEGLAEMQEAGELADWVDVKFIAQRLYRRVRSVTIDWSRGHIPSDKLLDFRSCEIYLILLGISTDKTRDRIEGLLKKVLKKIQ